MLREKLSFATLRQWRDSMTTTQFFAYLKSFRRLDPAYQIIEYDGADTFPDGRHASANVTVRKGAQLLQLDGFATLRLPLSSTSMVTIPYYKRTQTEIVPPEIAQAIDNDVVCCLFGDVYLRKYRLAPLLRDSLQGVRVPPKLTPRAVGITKHSARMAKTTYQTVTRDRACRAVKVYNEGLDGRGVRNADLDIRAHKIFANGLGRTVKEIEEQVRFIGNRKEYGGVAGRPVAIRLAPTIAQRIFEIREEYERVAGSALAIRSQVADRSTIEFLFPPFVKSLEDKNNTSNWLVWAVKFWHHLNKDAFPIESSEVDRFFRLSDYNSPVDRYMKLLERFRDFVLSHQDWLSHLRQADGGVDGVADGKPVCSDNKLWDKMCMGLVVLDKAGE